MNASHESMNICSVMTTRCAWLPDNAKSDYIRYHDTEWGVAAHDDRMHMELLILEGAQAGLSWYSILQRREGYRAAFCGFDPHGIAAMTDDRLEELLLTGNIIRNRLKVFSARTNAAVFRDIQREYGTFDAYIWQFVGGRPVINRPQTLADVPAQTDISRCISADLKKRGMSFVGPTIIYAYMQAAGLVDDHMAECFKNL